jgi:ribosome maturation factor RimP
MPETVEKITDLIMPLLADTDMFIVSIKIKPINNIKVYLDADSGLSIEKCAKLNRGLYNAIEAEQMYPGGDFSLEVSSPGVDEPLIQFRQYKKNIGRKVLITTLEGAEKLGILKEAKEDILVLEMPIPKKKETTIVEIPFSEIKQTVVQIIF